MKEEKEKVHPLILVSIIIFTIFLALISPPVPAMIIFIAGIGLTIQLAKEGI